MKTSYPQFFFFATVSVLVLVLSFVTTEGVSPPLIPKQDHCTELYQPVCASDGRTYGNLCKFNNAFFLNSNLRIVYSGECEPERPVLPQDGRPCPKIYKPICASNGQTYDNECEFGNALFIAQSLGQSLKIVHQGACKDDEVSILPVEQKVCRNRFNPICGSDGNVYRNKCWFRNAKLSNPSLRKKPLGECKYSEETFLPFLDSFCSKIYRPVCGSDGVTYTNKCMFKNARRMNPRLEKEHGGECKDVPVSIPPVLEKACPRLYQPVCGSDGTTYPNKCEFERAIMQNSALKVEHLGECKDVPVSILPVLEKACPRLYRPICGSDGITYPNKCEFSNARLNLDITVKHLGACTKDDDVQIPRRTRKF
jgi:hypothetical protein